MLIVFDDMIVDMESNKKLSPIVTELFLRGRKLKISLVFIPQYYFKYYTKEPYSFSVNNKTLSSEKPLRFRKN